MLVLTEIIFLVNTSFSQSFQYQPDKPGQLIFNNQIEKCPGLDLTKVTNKLTSIVEYVQKNNAVMEHPTGFDALTSLSVYYCGKNIRKEDFGIQSAIYFSFNHFYIENEVSHRATGNTAHGTEIKINSPINYISTQFDEAGFLTDDPPHLKHALEKALANLRNYYTTAAIIKEIAPGVRLYAPRPGTWFAGTILVFNPDRPDIWIPVTVKEVMEAKLAYYKIKEQIDSINQVKTLALWAKMNFKPDPGQNMTTSVYKEIKKEYENLTADELNRPAFSGSGEESGVSMINARGNGRAVVRFNPACWDRTLPATAVQYMSLEYRPATTSDLEEFKPRNHGLADYVGLFYNSLPVEKLGVLIDLK